MIHHVQILVLLACILIVGCAPSDPAIGSWAGGGKILTLNRDGTLRYNWGRGTSHGTYSRRSDSVIEIRFTTDVRGRGAFVAGDQRVTSITNTKTATMNASKTSLEFDGETFRRR